MKRNHFLAGTAMQASVIGTAYALGFDPAKAPIPYTRRVALPGLRVSERVDEEATGATKPSH